MGVIFTSMKIDIVTGTISAEIEDSDALVEGTIGRKDKRTHTRTVQFTITDDVETKVFRGTMDITQS